MKAIRKILMVLAVVILASMFVVAVGSCKKSEEKATEDTEAAVEGVKLCMSCGQIKGSELCCKPEQAKCEKCGLAKGSPGCCKIPKGAKEAEICTKCGQIKGTDLCCKPDQPKCEKCGLIKGSPGCCKI